MSEMKRRVCGHCSGTGFASFDDELDPSSDCVDCRGDGEVWVESEEVGSCPTTAETPAVRCASETPIGASGEASDGEITSSVSCASTHPAVVASTFVVPDGIELVYRNHRGEVRTRRIVPLGVYFGSTQWHPEPQWLLNAIDAEDNTTKQFALGALLGTPQLREAVALEREARLLRRAESAEQSAAALHKRQVEEGLRADRAETDLHRAHRELTAAGVPTHDDLLAQGVPSDGELTVAGRIQELVDQRAVSRRWVEDAHEALDLFDPAPSRGPVGFLLTVAGRLEKLREALAVERERSKENFSGLRYVVYDDERTVLAAFKDEQAARVFWSPIKNSGFRTLKEVDRA